MKKRLGLPANVYAWKTEDAIRIDILPSGYRPKRRV
jgi:hypothetical protein